MVIQEVLCAQLYNNAFLYHSVNNSQHQSVSFAIRENKDCLSTAECFRNTDSN